MVNLVLPVNLVPPRMGRLRGAGLIVGIVAMGLTLTAPPASAADETYLGRMSNQYMAFGTANTSVTALYAVNVSSSALVNFATGVVSADPAGNVSRIVVYPSAGAGSPGWMPIATFEQTSYRYDAVHSAYDVEYAGSYSFTPGTYWIGVAAVSGSPGWQGAQGTQTSPWTWVAPPGNERLTVDGGSTWQTYDFSGSPMITLSMRGAAASSSAATSAPPDQLQQVPVPSSGRCADVDDAHLTWGTGLRGGWHTTWASWAQSTVCTRTFHYADQGWTIAGLA